MKLEISSPELIRARALSVALLSPSFDELCYRVAALSIGFERMTELVQNAADKATQENHVSTMAMELFKQLEPLIAKGQKFQTHRPKGSVSKKVEHIRNLVAAQPANLTAKELLAKADMNIIGNMKERTFANHVTQARKLSP